MSDRFIIVLCIEYHANSRCNYPILNFIGKVHHMHFKIKSLTIYGVFWVSMEMELVCVKLRISIEILWCWCVKRIEVLCFLFFIFIFYEYFYCVVRIPIYFFILDILIIFLKFILNFNCRKRVTMHVISKIDWTLSIFSTSWKVYFPVCSVLWIIISLWWDLSEILHIETCYR